MERVCILDGVYMLHRGPGLLSISGDVIGLAGHFGSIIVKCRPIDVSEI